MKSENWNEIQNLISKYRTWIDVLDTDKGEDFYFVVSGTIRICHQRVLRLVTKWPFKKYPRGHVFIIPEYELDKVMKGTISISRKECSIASQHRRTLNC